LRVNLNFVLLQAQRNAEIRAVKYYKEVDKLEQNLVDSHAMLALLKRQQATQSDINSDPLQVRQFVQSSCHAVKGGQSLLNEVRNVNVGSFLENIIQSDAPTSVSKKTLDQFMSDCRVNSGSMSRSQDGWIIRQVRSLSEWF